MPTTDSEGAESRWKKETSYLAQLWQEKNLLKAGSTAVDFGCGIGRLSKTMIESFNATVIGVDISLSMLRYALQYVASTNFVAMPRPALDKLNVQVDFAASVWVLQHCPFIEEEVAELLGAAAGDEASSGRIRGNRILGSKRRFRV